MKVTKRDYFKSAIANESHLDTRFKIYKGTNAINGKGYIGYTKRDNSNKVFSELVEKSIKVKKPKSKLDFDVKEVIAKFGVQRIGTAYFASNLEFYDEDTPVEFVNSRKMRLIAIHNTFFNGLNENLGILNEENKDKFIKTVIEFYRKGESIEDLGIISCTNVETIQYIIETYSKTMLINPPFKIQPF